MRTAVIDAATDGPVTPWALQAGRGAPVVGQYLTMAPDPDQNWLLAPALIVLVDVAGADNIPMPPVEAFQ